MTDIVILPGFGGSGAEHWQSLWQSSTPEMRRFSPASWHTPDLADWMKALDTSVADCKKPPILVAHSLACLLVAHWQLFSALPVAGAMLVAVPNPDEPVFTDDGASFVDPPASPFRFPTLIVASSDDPFATIDYAQMRAQQWGAGLVEAGALGHMGSAAGLGGWKEGRDLLAAFQTGLGQL